MQEDYEDFYGQEGCCLTCSDKEEGCLCSECNCTQCCWYSEPHESGEYDKYGYEKGKCDKKKRGVNRR